jgi:hypothetical protein
MHTYAFSHIDSRVHSRPTHSHAYSFMRWPAAFWRHAAFELMFYASHSTTYACIRCAFVCMQRRAPDARQHALECTRNVCTCAQRHSLKIQIRWSFCVVSSQGLRSTGGTLFCLKVF